MIILALKKILFGRESIAEQISAASRSRMRRAGNRCELTGCSRRDRELEVHHIFSVAHFPMFAASVWNLRVVRSDLHRKYHSFNGGTRAPATPLTWVVFVLLVKLGVVR